MQLLGREGCSVVFSGFRAYGALKAVQPHGLAPLMKLSVPRTINLRVWDLGCRGLKFRLKMHQTVQLLLIEGVMVLVTGLV